jgi:hypothetical protein
MPNFGSESSTEDCDAGLRRYVGAAPEDLDQHLLAQFLE